MTWNESDTLDIFVPSKDPYGENWVEQVLGTIIKPIVIKHQSHISWLWITRYWNAYNVDKPPEGYALPKQFYSGNKYRFVKFRLHVDADDREELHQEVIQLAEREKCFTGPNGWIPYNPIEDLGGNRFIRADATTEERSQRAKLIAYFMDATIRLMLDSLFCDDSGKWSLEHNASGENPNGSFFESVHHLFCNATGVPTTVLVGGKWSSLQLRTYGMNHNIILAGNEDQINVIEVPVLF